MSAVKATPSVYRRSMSAGVIASILRDFRATRHDELADAIDHLEDQERQNLSALIERIAVGVGVLSEVA